MICRGEYSTKEKITYGVVVNHTKYDIEAVLVLSGTVVSAYKANQTEAFCYQNTKAKDMVQLLQTGLRGCTAKNGVPMPFTLGAMTQHEFTKAHKHFTMQLHNNEMVGAFIEANNERISLEYNNTVKIPDNIPYVTLTTVNKKEIITEEDELNAVPVRSVQEIALEKDDLTWLENKKYFIVNDDETAEKIFSFLDTYKGIIAYDTETTGLKINCFGKIGSKYKEELEKFNAEHPNEKIRADRLVGIIFCVEEDTSYYFPCFNRKFKNLYSDKNSTIRKRIIQNTKARYTIGDKVNSYGDMKKYVLNTPEDEWDLGVILMERVRDILEKGNIVTHGGTFEWKVGWQYEIDTNICDDTMIMHQIMFKFRGTTANRGEPSNLKYLSKHELGIDQWELKDFFPNWKEDKKGLVREKAGEKKNTRIDFSYMDYEGTKVYAPTDGDATFLLEKKYKPILVEQHKELIYLYQIELIVSMAIAYMEFYGHRIDESKILGARLQTQANILMLESEIRQTINYANLTELDCYEKLKSLRKQIKEANGDTEELNHKLEELCKQLDGAIRDNKDNQLNLASPGQVADLFYNKLGYPKQDDSSSVAKKAIKALTKEKNDDGTPKYPVAVLYSQYKAEDTLMTKFFDNLPYFMYPGGYIFSSYGQIAAATGRMSCIDEDTLITTVGGYKKIKDMQVGDLVYCYDNDGNIRIRKVLNVLDQGVKECIRVNWESNGSNTSGSLVCTPDHKILSKENGWVRADSLRCNDKVYYLRRSKEDRPRLLGTDGKTQLEQLKINNDAVTTSVKDDEFIRVYMENKGSIRATAVALGITYYKASCIVKRLNLCYNHRITSIEKVGEHHVYDLEIEEYHNFIANEICVHNCKQPNAQQYPKAITKIVIPRDGYIMADADYSQIEYRVLTALAHNDGLAKLFSDPDSDYHTLMASLMYEVPYSSVTPSMRSAAKSYNFGIPYGMGIPSLAILLTGKNTPQTRDEAAEKYEAYFKNQPKTRQFFNNVKEMAQINGYTKTLFNRYRYYSFVDKDGKENNGKKAAALRQAGNAVIQGCLAGDTLIQTKEYGIVKIEEVVNKHLRVWDGDKWSDGDILYSGKKQKCIITFTNGQRFICSPIHKFLVKSAKGSERFVECKDLITREKSKNPHRIAITRGYEPSDWEYNVSKGFINNIGDSFKQGVFLGMLDSHIIEVKEHSEALASEVSDLNIPDYVFMDTEMLRGFLRGLFDGDGGISGKTITLTFGKQAEFEPMCRQVQKALLFFGIRSRYYKANKIVIKTNDNQKFLDTIGFINKEKQEAGRALECSIGEKLFGQVLIPQSVEITDEYIDMYDVCNTDGGYYVADGIITHNTAADIFKIGVARNFNYIRRNKLFGKLLIVNMIHDEQLLEIDAQSVNVQRVLTDVGKNMQFEIEGFPPLYIGAGVGPAWGYAKGKMAEIHPTLLEHLTKEAEAMPIFKSEEEVKAGTDTKEVLDYFKKRVYDFRRQKVIDYLVNPENWHKDIHPAIGGLINLQFNFGRGDEAKAYTGPNGEKYTDSEFLALNIKDFIAENNLEVEADWFVADETALSNDPEDDKEYTDDEEEAADDLEYEEENKFTVLDDSGKLFGSNINDLINIFGTCILEKQKICGINTKDLYYKKKDAIIDFLLNYVCDENEKDATQVVFLTDANVLKYTGIYISGLSATTLENKYKEILKGRVAKDSSSYTEGDIHNRSQAK